MQYFDSYPSGPTGFQAIGFNIDPPAPYILARGSDVGVLSCPSNTVRFPSRQLSSRPKVESKAASSPVVDMLALS